MRLYMAFLCSFALFALKNQRNSVDFLLVSEHIYDLGLLIMALGRRTKTLWLY